MAKRREVGGSVVREWAKAEGMVVGQRGRFSQELVDAFHKANKGSRYVANHVPTRKISGTRVTSNGRKIPVTVSATLTEVREVMRAEGMQVGERGRVSAEVLSAFAARPRS